MIDLTHLRILLVEDNELDARSLIRHLRADDGSQYDVAHVGDLASALERTDIEGFDCILLDLSLPDSHGLVGVETMLDRVAKSPIVVLTGLDDPEVAVQAVERGAQDYLTKGTVDAERLSRAIRYAITRHNSEAQLRSAHEQLDVLHDRERIARDLHDTVIQQLFATGMNLQAMASRLPDPEARDRLLDAVDGIDEGIHQLREAIFGIHQQQAELSLVEEMHELVSEKATILGFSPVVRTAPDLPTVSARLRHDLLSTLGEALSNVTKHASASAVEVTLTTEDGKLVLAVTDNGVGVQSVAAATDELTGHGLRNMRARASQWSGECAIRPGPGGGTTMSWSARPDL